VAWEKSDPFFAEYDVLCRGRLLRAIVLHERGELDVHASRASLEPHPAIAFDASMP